MFGKQVSEFSSWKIIKKLIKQAGPFIISVPSLVVVVRSLLAYKSYITFHQEGILFKSYFGQECYCFLKSKGNAGAVGKGGAGGVVVEPIKYSSTSE